jgi:heme-degrading monooxygenase HmoA
MFARMTTLQGSPDQVEPAIESIHAEVLPGVKDLDGFDHILALVDRSAGKMVAITFWESEAAMRASEEVANRLRESASTGTANEIAGVDRFEVVVDSRSG